MMKLESTVKQEQILEAALRRFSHFGITKTTLTEVADDLAVSKQSLFYYFPDKQSLAKAVVEKITTEYIENLKRAMQEAESTEGGLLELTKVKSFFFEKYFRLIIQAEQFELVTSSSLHNWRQQLGEAELKLIITLFEKGVRQEELKPLDAAKTGKLLLETLYAFSRCVKERGMLPEAAAFQEALLKQQEVIKLFYTGLKAPAWKD